MPEIDVLLEASFPQDLDMSGRISSFCILHAKEPDSGKLFNSIFFVFCAAETPRPLLPTISSLISNAGVSSVKSQELLNLDFLMGACMGK